MAVRKRRKTEGKRPEVVAEIEPAVLTVPPHITSYLYKMGYQTPEKIVGMISNLLVNGE
jgi:hypothetical protein